MFGDAPGLVVLLGHGAGDDIDLFHGFLGAVVDLRQGIGGLARQLGAILRLARTFLNGGDRALGLALDRRDHGADFGGRRRGALGQLPDLVGDDGEAAPLLAGARRLDGGVQRQQVGLVGNVVNGLDDARNRLGTLTQGCDHLGRLLHRMRDALDLRRRGAYDLGAARRMLARRLGDKRRSLGIFGDGCDPAGKFGDGLGGALGGNVLAFGTLHRILRLDDQLVGRLGHLLRREYDARGDALEAGDQLVVGQRRRRDATAGRQQRAPRKIAVVARRGDGLAQLLQGHGQGIGNHQRRDHGDGETDGEVKGHDAQARRGTGQIDAADAGAGHNQPGEAMRDPRMGHDLG